MTFLSGCLAACNFGLPGFQTNLSCGPPLLGDLLISLGLGRRIGTASSMSFGIHALDTVRDRTELDVLGEFLLVCILILLRQVPHVVGCVLCNHQL